MIRAILVGALLLATPVALQAQGARYPLKAADGSPIENRKIKPEISKEAETMPGAVVAVNPQGDVTLVEFYDLNCPFCRRASADLEAMVKADPRLRLVLVPFPVLGIPSVIAGRVELAVAKSVPAEKFYEFHRALYAGRGTIDGQRALAVATGPLGLDAQKIADAANEDGVTETMKAHLRFANSHGSKATPLFFVQDVMIDGYPGRATLETIVKSVRKCGKAVC